MLLFILLSGALAAPIPSVTLSEQLLDSESRKGSPRLAEIEASFQNLAVREAETRTKYSPELFGQASYSETNERALVPFQPIFSPITNVQTGLRQQLRHGVSVNAAVTTDQRNGNSTPFSGRFRHVTTTILQFTAQVDLWRDVFGRMSKADLDSVKYEREQALLERDIQEKVFRLSLRRLYWSLVANQEAYKLSEALLQTAQRQTKETQQRFRQSVAEADEVARYEAQVASREGTLAYLRFQRESLVKELRNLLPQLGTGALQLDTYDINTTMNDVLACTAVIGAQATVPLNFTSYDEAVVLMRKMQSARNQYNDRYSDPDFKFFGTVKSTGVGSDPDGNGYKGSFKDSIDDQTETNRMGYEVGLMVTIPLDDAKDDVQKARTRYDEKRIAAMVDSTDARLKNTHAQLVTSITYLNDVIKAQKVTADRLNRRLTLMRKKYEQARVSVNDLVMDQDAYLNSELTLIDTQLQVINTIFDYLVVFPETPCAFNRI